MPVFFRDSKLRYARGIQLLFRHRKGLAFPSEPLVHAIAYRLQHDRVNAGLRVRSVQDDLALSILKGDDRPSVIFGCKACMFMLSTNVFESMLFCLSSIVAGNMQAEKGRWILHECVDVEIWNEVVFAILSVRGPCSSRYAMFRVEAFV
jgi:hypothetical protein